MNRENKNAIYIQSGGPTSVINHSAAGVIDEIQSNKQFEGRLFVPTHGILGLVKNDLIDVTKFSKEDIKLLKNTPSMAFGSTRYEIRNDDEYKMIIDTLQSNEIQYILVNGGNGSVKFAKKLSLKLQQFDFTHQLIVIPKTVDNDINGIHHSPGFPSAARHVVLTTMELYHDMQSYDTDLIVVAEVMGRNSGWVAASTIVATENGCGPDLIYVPEMQFDLEKFVRDIQDSLDRKKKCLIIFSEGVKLEDGKHLFEIDNPFIIDSQKNMGGISAFMNRFLNENFDCKVRVINLDLMQRSAIHNATSIDKNEAYELGIYAVRSLLEGKSDVLVTHSVVKSSEYKTKCELIPLNKISNENKVLKTDYINEAHNYISFSYLDYIKPLIGKFPKYIDYKKTRKGW